MGRHVGPLNWWLRWMPLTLLGMLLLALVGCATPTPPGGALVGTPSPTNPVPPAHALSWQTAHFPAPPYDSEPFPPGFALGLATSDSNTAYECAKTANNQTAAIYVTHDAAHTWSQAGTLNAGVPIYSCGLVVDERQPATVVAQIFSGSVGFGNFNGTFHSFISDDGGQTWSPFTGPAAILAELATVGNTTYALFRPPIADLAPLRTTFVTSADGMHTWNPIDQDITSGNGTDPGDTRNRYATQFWLNPTSETLLAESATSWANSTRFFSSENGGQSWEAIATPGADQFVVQTPTANTPWTICGLYSSGGNINTPPPTDLICTDDGGHTWTHRGSAPPSEPVNAMTPEGYTFAIADDGSLLMGYDSVSRLAPGKTEIESLGPLPPAEGNPWQLIYAPGNGQGRIWGLPQSGGPTNSPATLPTIITATYV